jgi:hypothetical protein
MMMSSHLGTCTGTGAVPLVRVPGSCARSADRWARGPAVVLVRFIKIVIVSYARVAALLMICQRHNVQRAGGVFSIVTRKIID